MRILMIAPEPFFEPRGTPFSEYHRIRALGDLGHAVDLVTYPFGRDVSLPQLQVFRTFRPPFVREVGVGPSWVKMPLDVALTMTTIRRALVGRYDAVHSHEEGGLIGILIADILGVPHLYDMHSSLPQQLTNFAFSESRLLRVLFTQVERFVIRRSRVTIVICPYLQEVVRGIDPSARVELIENAPGSGDPPEAGSGQRLRAELGVGDSTPIVLYTGTLEAYQGLDLLFAAAPSVLAQFPETRFVLVGGRGVQLERTRRQAADAGAAQALLFVGERPAEDIPRFLDAADVLVSPRSTGWNTPLKIYQYLRAGRPIVATRLLTHTQVLNDQVAILVEPTPEGFSAGILQVLRDPAAARDIGRRAHDLAETKYNYDSYLAATQRACTALFPGGTPAVASHLA